MVSQNAVTHELILLAHAGAHYIYECFDNLISLTVVLARMAKAHASRVEALRACRAAPKPKPMASKPLEAEALALLEKQREGLSWSVSETDASGRPMPI